MSKSNHTEAPDVRAGSLLPLCVEQQLDRSARAFESTVRRGSLFARKSDFAAVVLTLYSDKQIGLGRLHDEEHEGSAHFGLADGAPTALGCASLKTLESWISETSRRSQQPGALGFVSASIKALLKSTIATDTSPLSRAYGRSAQ
jgi:hypothetical protein